MQATLYRTIYILIFLIGISSNISGQDSLRREEKIKIENSDKSIIDNKKQQQQLLGNVRLTHDSIFMFCDSAWMKDNHLEATGNVVIIQNDTINAFSDSLYYDGESRRAELYKNVVLKNGSKDLFSQILIYDIASKVATITDTATLVSNTMTMSSLRGVYNVESKMAHFYDEVSIVDRDMQLKADSIRYDTDVDRAYFIGPTYITQDDRQIYCERGFYDIEAGRAFFSENAKILEDSLVATAQNIYYSRQDSSLTLQGDAIIIDSSSTTKGDEIIINNKNNNIRIIGNAYYQNEEQTIIGPEINYNKKSKNIDLIGFSRVTHENGYLEGESIKYDDLLDSGVANGNVRFIDTIEDRIILTDKLAYNDATGYYKATTATLRPLYKQIIDDDTLFLAADTLLNFMQGDTINVIKAMGDVKIIKSDFQAICDSLYYSDLDSTFHLYKDPISWSDTTQISADTLSIHLINNEVSEILARGHAMIISEDAPNYYNQIRGSYIHSYLDSNTLKKMYVEGNAESIYLVRDDNQAYIGVNKSLCGSMDFHFLKNELEDIEFFSQPSNTMVPMSKATESDLKLDGFIWHIDNRPLDKSQLRIVRSIKKEQPSQQVNDIYSSKVSEILKKGDNIQKTNKFGGQNK